MGYYCTVPQCTSLAGKTKNVKFHRFPRDTTMADKWNLILKRGKPYTKYSKVCSLHFTQADYNVTTMGQWKTLSKEAVPSQNLPKLNPDGTVMVIRKSRTVKYREGKREDSDKMDKSWQASLSGHSTHLLSSDTPMIQDAHENSLLAYRLQTLGAIANNIAPVGASAAHGGRPRKQDAIMQTDPVQNEDDDTQPNNSYSEVSDKSYSSEIEQYNQSYPKEYPKESSPYLKDTPQYPKESTPYHKESAPYPKESTPYPKESTPYPKESTPYPKESTPYPKESTPYPKESTPYPKESTPYPKESTPYPREGTPYKDTSYPRDTVYKDTSYPKDTDYPKDTTYSKDAFKDGYSKDTFESKNYEPKDYRKPTEEYLPQTNEEYNKEAEKYALVRKSHNGYDPKDYQKQVLQNGYQKMPVPDMYSYEKYNREAYYQNGYTDSAEILRNQQHNLQMLQEQQHRINDNQNFFNENHIKQEIDISGDDDKFLYERSKEQLESSQYATERRIQSQRIIDHLQHQVKQEPDAPPGSEAALQAQSSPYYGPGGTGYYSELPRPGPELLIAKQNALAAHTQLWQNTMKRPFYYSESPHFNGPQLLHRYEDIPRILQ